MRGSTKKAILSGPVFLRNFCHTTALTSICKVCIHSDIVKILLVDLSCLWDVLWSFNCEQNIHSFVACTLTLFNNHICLQDEKCRAHSHNIWAIDLDSEVSLHGTLNTHNRTLNILHNIKLAVAVSFIFFLIAGKITVNKSNITSHCDFKAYSAYIISAASYGLTYMYNPHYWLTASVKLWTCS